MSRLSIRHRRFVNEYVRNKENGTQAAIHAGFSHKTAASIASELLKKPEIRIAINDIFRKVEMNSELTAIEVRNAILRLMRFDPRQAFNSDGTMKRIQEMSEDTVLAVAGIDSDDLRGDIKRLRFVDRVRVVELAAKVLGMLKLEVTGKDGRPLVPPTPPINFARIDDETLKRIAGISNGAGSHS